ncbi:MAG TPA: peptidoglycan bridge formation glycyltransferase FemA/FemB family protein [Desulfobacteraceae bacterium]|nr:peptidoglycan bridge formation glycyltransferase FemA/FemB family protein [Desulfobacteraceae bacterium]
MKIQLQPKETKSLFATDIVFQTFFWSQVKSRLGWRPSAFNFSCPGLSGDLLLLTRTLGREVSVAYVPQGPEFGPAPEHYGRFLESLSDRLTDQMGSPPAFIRYDLPWKSQYMEDGNEGEKRRWPGRPEARLQEVRMNFGTNAWKLRKAVTDLTVADAVHLDLDGGEDEILSRMKPKTRYNIRLAAKKGVSVFFASIELLPIFYELYCQTAERNGFPVCGYEHFSALFPVPASDSDSPERHFLLATHGDRFLAGAIITISRRTATYLFGASSTENRNLMGSYAIQWAAIRLARAKGCLVYDMGAVAPAPDPDHPFYGMYRFKTGFGGSIIHRTGSWDYPLDEEKYEIFRNQEIIGRMQLNG